MTLDDIRKAKTSDLIAFLNPDVFNTALGDAEATPEQIKAFFEAVAAEIDRRLPVPA